MSEKYIYLEHTADAKFQAFGSSLEESFANSALAMFNIMCRTSTVKEKITKDLAVKGKDKESLLYNFLEELIFLFDSENFLLSKIKNMIITEKAGNYKLKATVVGDNSAKYEFFILVKAITYNEMHVREERVGKRRRFITQAVVDV